MNVRYLTMLPVFCILLLVACEESRPSQQGAAAATGPVPEAPAVPDPSVGSYPGVLDRDAFASEVVVAPDHPFLRALDVAPATLDGVFYTDDGSIQERLFGNEGVAEGAVRVEVDSRNSEAWLGSVRYRAASGALLIAERVSDEVADGARNKYDGAVSSRGITMPPQRAASGSVPGVSASTGAAIPESVTIWKRDLDSRIVAGPAVFDNAVLIATARPSWIALDRRTGAVLFELPLDRLLTGPIVYLSGAKRIAALGADGSVCLYSPDAGSGSDPVELFLGPNPEAMKLIRTRASEKVTAFASDSALAVYPYDEKGTLPTDKVVLVRYECGDSRSYRVYADGLGDSPVLVDLFSADGDLLASTLDYTGMDKFIVRALEKGAVYYCLVADLSGGEEGAAGKARLVVAPKK